MVAELITILAKEIKYFRVLLLTALITVLGLGLFNSLNGTYRSILEVGTLIQIVVVISLATTSSMDKRERLLRVLPVKKLSCALVSPLVPILSGAVLLLIWIGFATIATETPPMVFDLWLVLALIFRFLINTSLFWVIGLLFELTERIPWLGIPLITVMGAVIGYTTESYIEGEFHYLDIQLLAQENTELALIILFAFAGAVILLYFIIVDYTYYRSLSKQCMK